MRNLEQVVKKIAFHIEKKKPKSIDEKLMKNGLKNTLKLVTNL